MAKKEKKNMMMITVVMMKMMMKKMTRETVVVRLPGALLVEHSGGFLSVLYSSHAPEFSLLFLYIIDYRL